MREKQGRLCLYLDTSILIRALECPKARGFLEECRRHRCVASSVHGLEGWRSETLEEARELLERLGVDTVEVDVRRLRQLALKLVERRGWSPRRMVDLMHVLAARELGCQGITAVDRFIWRRAKEYGLLYVNHIAGCP